jgi:hypothetical protein
MGEAHTEGREAPGPPIAEQRALLVREALASYAPADSLTVGEAGRLLGLSEALLRRRIQAGQLLHETGRRGGREVRLIRVVDLLAAFGSPARSSPERSEATAQVPRSTSGDQALLELRQERDQLLERCSDLDGRLALQSVERQEMRPLGAPTQGQWLELESLVARRFVWWRRPATLGWVASVAILVWLWDGADDDRVLAQERMVETLSEHRLAREQFSGQLAQWRDQARETQGVLDQERRSATLDRSRFDERLREAHSQAEKIGGMVREDRLLFEGDRLQWAALLEDSQRALDRRDSAWQVEVRRSEDQQALLRRELATRDEKLRAERERNARADLARREQEEQTQARQAALVQALEGQLQAARSQSEQFQGDLQHMGALQADQEARIATGLERLEQMRAAQEARFRDEQWRAQVQSRFSTLGRWFAGWAPRIQQEVLKGARTPEPDAPAADPGGQG